MNPAVELSAAMRGDQDAAAYILRLIDAQAAEIARLRAALKENR